MWGFRRRAGGLLAGAVAGLWREAVQTLKTCGLMLGLHIRPSGRLWGGVRSTLPTSVGSNVGAGMLQGLCRLQEIENPIQTGLSKRKCMGSYTE